jgi:hypothetical protein
MKPIVIITLAGLALTAGCRKDTVMPELKSEKLNTGMIRGLPEDPGKINGFFYAVETGLDETHFSRSVFAFFAAQGGDLRKAYDQYVERLNVSDVVGDLSMGVVKMDTLSLEAVSLTGPRLYFTSSASVDKQHMSFKWSWLGTPQIKPDSFLFQNPFPLIGHGGKPFVLDQDSAFYVNADSVVAPSDEGDILLMGDHYRNGPYVSLRYSINKGMNYMYWSPEEVKQHLKVSGDMLPGLLRFRSCTHFHQYREGKLYLFTFVSRVDCSIKLKYE